MIAAYCRVSTARQKADSQVAEISKWLKANGYDENEVEWYIDKESGKTLKRPEFERLQADIFSGRIKTVRAGSKPSFAGSWIAFHDG